MVSSIARFDTWQASDGTNVARFNAGQLEVWDGSAWIEPGAGPKILTIDEVSGTTGSPATGTFTDTNGITWAYYKFTGSGSITFDKPGYIDCLVVGGGGGGADYGSNRGAGGGGGAVRYGLHYTTATTHSISIGAGASGVVNGKSGDGGDSSLGSLLYGGGGMGSLTGSTSYIFAGNDHGGSGGGLHMSGASSRVDGGGAGASNAGISLNYDGTSREYGKGGSGVDAVVNQGWGGRNNVNTTGQSGSSGVVVVKVLA